MSSLWRGQFVGDQAGERQGRGRRGGGGVADVDGVLGAVDDEVVDQLAVAAEGLGTDRRPVPASPWRPAAPGPSAPPRRRRSARLAACRSSISPARQWAGVICQVPGPGERFGRDHAAARWRVGRHRGRAPTGRWDRSAPRPATVAGQVGAEEREVGVRDRVDVGADQIRGLGGAGSGSRRGRGRCAGSAAPRRRRRGGPTRARRRRQPPPRDVVPPE